MNFATQLTKELDADGRPRGEQAKIFGISGSNLSQFASGTEPCGRRQLAKILAKMPTDAAERLAAAWLLDQMPEAIEPGRIVVQVVETRVQEDEESLPAMDPDLRGIIFYLAKRAIKDREIRTALLSFGAALGGPGGGAGST